ncbi:Acetamidase [Arachnomyces sp. PD_36]|nr:Acetamidase [Arachnomyces sp. PD_36]
MATGSRDWKAIAAAKRESILQSIPEQWRLQNPIPPPSELRNVTGSYIQQFLNSREIEITETDAVEIAKKTTSGQWTAVEVTKAFCHRASIAHQLVNCLHEIFFDAAIADAERLDAYYAINRKPIGPLHGLPVSLKDQFHVKGVETTMGYLGWIGTFQGNKADPRKGVFESELVRELRALGAVLYCKTSVPTTLMSGETANHIIGYTYNPTNRLVSAGGSSGGEGSLIALGGSPVGIGSDIGGSVRIPAAYNGLYGLRPSAGRIPYEGTANSIDGQNTLLSVLGPLATTAGALKLVFKSVLSQQPWLYDPLALEIPWRDAVEQETLELVNKSTASQGQLAFAVVRHNNVVHPHPPVARAVQIVAQVLGRLGHKMIDWNPPSHAEAAALADASYHLDGGADVRKHYALSGEEVLPQFKWIYKSPDEPQKLASEIAAINVSKREYQKRYMDYWNSTVNETGTGRPVDGVISPISPFAAARPDEHMHLDYTFFVNTLDYTSVVFPVTHADRAIDVVDAAFEPLNSEDKKVQDNYDPKLYHGAPVGLQLVGRRLQEEKMLVLAEHIGEAVARGKE